VKSLYSKRRDVPMTSTAIEVTYSKQSSMKAYSLFSITYDCAGWFLACIWMGLWIGVAIETGAQGSPPVAPTEALSPADERAAFRVPAGFEVQLVASEPQIQKPMNLAFDARGRLWVTHSVEYPFAQANAAIARDGLSVLEGFGPDGRATTSTLFADGLNIPIGVLPLPSGNEVIVWSIPNIWKLTDTDHDGRADRREVLYGAFAFDDTHGDQNAFRLGLDGWVYACHGFRNKSQIRLRGEGAVVLTMESGNTYRFRPDGSAIEQVSWGQVNPFGMCFDRLGNLFTADCHSKPLTMVLKGGYYDSFGKPHDGLGYAPLTTGNNHGSTGIAGAAVYESQQFPPQFHGSVFVGNVITNAIHCDTPAWRGSSPWVEKPTDFLSCDDWWFRPVDLQIGPDGALYVADFYNCIIGHYEVDLNHPRRDRHRGRIWRVVWKGDAAHAASTQPTDFTALGIDALVVSLGDPNQTARRLAFEQLLERAAPDPAEVVDALLKVVGPQAPAGATDRKAMALRALARLGRLDAPTIAWASDASAAVVRVHLVKALAGMPDWDAARGDFFRAKLLDSDPTVRRAAAEAIAEQPELASIAPLLEAWDAAATDDTQLIHSLRIALRNQLPAATPDQLAGLELKATAWPRLIDVAVCVPADATAWFAFGYAREHTLDPALMDRCYASVAQHCGEKRVDEAATTAQSRGAIDRVGQARVFESLLAGWTRRGRKLSQESELGKWGASLAAAALSESEDAPALPESELLLFLKVAKQMQLTPLAGPVLRVLADSNKSIAVRSLAAATSLVFDQVLDQSRAAAALAAVVVNGAEPSALRAAIAQQLGPQGSEISGEALSLALVSAPASLQQPIALALATTPQGADALLQIIGSGKASARLLQDKRVIDRLTTTGLPTLDERLADLTRELPAADERLKQLIGRVAAHWAQSTPSPEVGAAIYKKVCVQCHRIQEDGGRIGPQLAGIGQRGFERLLEDIVDPNRNVDEAFRMTTVTTTDGNVFSGLKLRDEGGDIVLADTSGKEVRIAAGEVEEVVLSRLSPMPSNIVDQIGETNLPDLLAYLMQASGLERNAVGAEGSR
jgi:putative heme-binding domain-containing protein